MKKKEKNIYKKQFDSQDFSEISMNNLKKELDETQIEDLGKSGRYKTEFAIYQIR